MLQSHVTVQISFVLEGFLALTALEPTTITSLNFSDCSALGETTAHLEVSVQTGSFAELFATDWTKRLLDRQGSMSFLHMAVKLDFAAKCLGACSAVGWVLVLSPVVEVQVPLILVLLIAVWASWWQLRKYRRVWS